MKTIIIDEGLQKYLQCLTVLYVEDEEESREQYREFLARLVGELVIAKNGTEGLEAWRHYKPDIIITDILMPVMDGLSMLREIRTVDREISVIVLSAFEETEYLIQSIDLGVSSYVIKPVDVSKFTDVLLKCAQDLLVKAKLVQAHAALREKIEIIARQAVTDELTELNNRRFFNENFSKMVSAARRHTQPLSLICIDLDHFKKVNDTFGHAVGDLVLKEFSTLLKTMVRAEDVACRLGGEEFMVLLPNTTCEAAFSMAERIRCSFEELPRTTTPAVTASFGVTGLQEGEDEDGMMRRVDAALYQAKHEGRNRVVVAV
jgi:two-component system cell cycle response regulator